MREKSRNNLIRVADPIVNVGGFHTEMVLMMGLGLLFSSITQMVPCSSAQEDGSSTQLPGCWAKIQLCLSTIQMRSTTPMLASLSSSTKIAKESSSSNSDELCSCLQPKNEKQCLCSILPSLRQDPTLASAIVSRLGPCIADATLDHIDNIYSPNNSTPSAPTLAPGKTHASSPSLTTVPPQRDPPRAPTPGKKNTKIVIMALSATGATVLIALGIGLCVRKAKRKKPHSTFSQNVSNQDMLPTSELACPPALSSTPPTVPSSKKDDFPTIESLQYELDALRLATNNFSNDNKVGEGGFGAVYKGVLADGREIAVKRLLSTSGQGDKEFKNEVVLLAKLQHRYLVKLIGFCLAGDEQLLVYEFMSNRSLDYFLFDLKLQEYLNWSKRYNIIKGIARGLLYLHEDSRSRIIHRDLKAANILLDAEMNPKIADFGMARIAKFEQTHLNTSRVVGTYGYMAPEYLAHGEFSTKSDVYSFGVLVLEIVSGKRISSLIYQSEVGENLQSYAWRCRRDGITVDFMDPTVKNSCSNKEEVIRCIDLGLLCVQVDIKKRPTMAAIVHDLNSYGASPTPAYSITQHPIILSAGSSDQSTTTLNSSSTSRSLSEVPVTHPR